MKRTTWCCSNPAPSCCTSRKVGDPDAADAKARARATAWMFAALNSIEPHIQNLTAIDLFHADQDWAKQRRPGALQLAESRLKSLSDWLDGRDYLEDRFTVADLLMTTVLRIPRQCDLVAQYPTLDAYRLRCESAAGLQARARCADGGLRREAGGGRLNLRVPDAMQREAVHR